MTYRILLGICTYKNLIAEGLELYVPRMQSYSASTLVYIQLKHKLNQIHTLKAKPNDSNSSSLSKAEQLLQAEIKQLNLLMKTTQHINSLSLTIAFPV